ncbi:hypothetical protein TGAMA5MH_08333 [Trichoderma gamsii]|uniref:DUF7703 domain-containing protein n=1 Tax=Trichoderma gamsii TaxID=398673 RepID=A0A2K0T2B6_9HYPO|nr:hypothetical protein TGAMA5MH_08333 [Trichoderma gamsii]
MSGETGPIVVPLAVAMVIAGFFAVAIFNSIEILIWIFSKFKRRKNFYFWSLVVAALGILIHSIAVFLRYFALAPNVLMCVFTLIGWWTMVTGQSFVMYSRLYLVVRDRRKIRWVLILIITNVFVLHLPVSILFLASNITHSTQFIEVFNIYERIQLIGFSIQESIISDICAHPRPEHFSERNRCQLASGVATTNPTPIHNGVQCVEDVERECTAKSRTNHIFDGRFDSPAPSSSLEPAENNHHLPVVASDACSTVSEGTKQ